MSRDFAYPYRPRALPGSGTTEFHFFTVRVQEQSKQSEVRPCATSCHKMRAKLAKKMCRKRTLFHSNWHFNTTKNTVSKISQKVQCVHVLPMIAFVRGTSKTLSHPAFFKRTVPRVIMILVPKVSQKLTSLQKDT